MKLTPVMEKYILHWGEMGTRWGVNRSVSQVHALLYLHGKPMSAEEIADSLNMARSNVSNSLKELLTWGLASRTHVMGDRRDQFLVKGETWDMLMTIVEGRKAREIDPTLTMLRQCVEEAGDDHETPEDVKARIASILVFMEDLTGWYEQVSRLPRPILIKLMKMGRKVAKLVSKK